MPAAEGGRSGDPEGLHARRSQRLEDRPVVLEPAPLPCQVAHQRDGVRAGEFHLLHELLQPVDISSRLAGREYPANPSRHRSSLVRALSALAGRSTWSLNCPQSESAPGAWAARASLESARRWIRRTRSTLSPRRSATSTARSGSCPSSPHRAASTSRSRSVRRDSRARSWALARAPVGTDQLLGSLERDAGARGVGLAACRSGHELARA